MKKTQLLFLLIWEESFLPVWQMEVVVLVRKSLGCVITFPTCRQIKPNRTIGSLATHRLFATHSPLVLDFLIQVLSVSSFQPHKNSVKKDGVDFSFSGTDYKRKTGC